MKKNIFYFFVMFACAMMLTSCEDQETGVIEFGIADQTTTGLRNENFVGLYADYLDAVYQGFIDAGCMEVSHTYSGGKLFTGKMMTEKQLEQFVKTHADAIISSKIQELQQKFPEPNPKKDILRFRYGFHSSEKQIYDKEIEI